MSDQELLGFQRRALEAVGLGSKGCCGQPAVDLATAIYADHPWAHPALAKAVEAAQARDDREEVLRLLAGYAAGSVVRTSTEDEVEP